MRPRLDIDEIEYLTQLHKTLKTKNEATKINCIILWGKGWSWLKIKEALLVSEHYISDLIRKYKIGKHEKVLGNKYNSNNYKMTDEQEKELCNYIDNNFVFNSKVVCHFIKKHFGIEYTPEGIVIALHRLGYSYKKPQIIPGKTPDEKTQNEFVEKVNDVLDNLTDNQGAYFGDGSGIVHNIKPYYGWIKKGTKKFIKTNTGRKKMNINGAYNPMTQEAICIEQEGSVSVNQVSNIKLLKKIIRLHPEYNEIFLFLDNATSNKGNRFISFVERLRELKKIKVNIIYLPPYAPNLNLIERLWKYAKKELLSEYIENYSQFREKVIDFFENDLKMIFHKEKLSKFIGRKFQIIIPPP